MNNREYEILNEHFRTRSQFYDSKGTWVKNVDILSQIVYYLQNTCNPPVRIIELGAGTGAVSKYIYEHYRSDKELYAIDISQDMLSKINHPSINVIKANVENIPFANQYFDACVTRQCLHYVLNLERAITEIKRVTKKNGRIVLAQIVPVDNSDRDYWNHIIRIRQPLRKHFFCENEWLEKFKDAGFTIEDVSHFTHRGSVNNWASKYSIGDKDKIKEYRQLLINASDTYRETYDVCFESDDITYKTHWFVALMRI